MREIDELLTALREVFERAGQVSVELCDFITAESLSIADVTESWFELCSSGGGPVSERTIEKLVEQRQTAARRKASRLFSEVELAILDDWQALEIKALTLSLKELLEV
ncbi:hypothetical protein OQJ62_15620 [Microbulbifer thermotolerans]|uniref:hypothetical protein n=1 Tax=Microbulbifer thermotolerans TaxID=252514 RepID=UPI002249306D|nr:hypothetical protein [Microbulbifer thermotolerans]MCX2796354.1 hypothetical protein [Microbulbifer thermotolerans]